MNASVDAVRVAGTDEGPAPVVVLSIEDEEDVLPIFIGFEEAQSIRFGMDATDIGRPLTHDLLLDTMEELGGRVERVVVSRFESGTYIGELHVATPRGTTVTVDARPSDCLALAVRTNVPIEVAPEVFEAGRDDAGRLEELEDIRQVVG